MMNMGLVGYNKRFLYAGIASGSTQGTRLLRNASIYQDIMNGGEIPQRSLLLGDFGDIPLVTIGDSPFLRYAWLIKGYNDPHQRYFSAKLCGATVVTENAYGC